MRQQTFGVTLQFLVSYIVASAVTSAIALLLIRIQLPIMLSIGMAALAGGSIGLLLTLNVQRGLYVLSRTLADLVRGVPVENEPAVWRWPLTALFEQSAMLSRRMQAQAERERIAAESHDELLRRVSEAAAQEERNRLARDLHDSIKQQLFGISMSVATLQARMQGDSEGAQSALADIQRSAHEVQVEMEALLQQLRPSPLDMAGLVEALRTQCQALGYRTGAEVNIEVGKLPSDERLPAGSQGVMFRIVQEALANIARHARAAHVWLRLTTQDNKLLIEVRDDGKGFGTLVPSHGMGFTNMRERAHAIGGSLDIHSTPGQGTTLRLLVKLLDLTEKLDSQQDKQLEQAFQRAEFAQKTSEGLLQLSGLFILLSLPFALVGLGLAAAIYQYVQSYRHRFQVALHAGKTSVHALALRRKDADVLGGVALLCGVSAWYLFVAEPYWSIRVEWSLAIGVTLILALFALINLVRYIRLTERYYTRLSCQERAQKVMQEERRCAASLSTWGVVLFIAAIAGLFNPITFPLPPHTAEQWTNDAILVILAWWPIFELAGLAQTLRWKLRLQKGGIR